MGVSLNILNILSDGNAEQALLNHKPELKEIAIQKTRMLHMYGVAELMFNYYDVFECKYLSREECYLLGLVHDIGYINGKENHEYYGCEILADVLNFGNNSVISKCIEGHGMTPMRYKEVYNIPDDEIMGELILLWWADMNVESDGEHAGEIVGFQNRLEGLKQRYGSKSDIYNDCKETIDWLMNKFSTNFLLKS